MKYLKQGTNVQYNYKSDEEWNRFVKRLYPKMMLYMLMKLVFAILYFFEITVKEFREEVKQEKRPIVKGCFFLLMINVSIFFTAGMFNKEFRLRFFYMLFCAYLGRIYLIAFSKLEKRLNLKAVTSAVKKTVIKIVKPIIELAGFIIFYLIISGILSFILKSFNINLRTR